MTINTHVLSLCAYLTLSAAALAGPVDSRTYGILCDGNFPPQPQISQMSVHQSAPHTIRFIRIQATLNHVGPDFAANASPADQVLVVQNETAGSVPVSFSGSALTTFPPSNQIAVDKFVRLPSPVTVGDSSWSVAGRSVYEQDLSRWESEWHNLTITLNDGAPTIFTDLGTLTPGAIAKSVALAPAETRWFRFTLPLTLNTFLGHYLDIDTEGSALTGGTNDTEVALYNEDGTRVGYDDDDGSNQFSQLTYGGGSRPAVGNSAAYNGRDGSTLPAGTYYLAVRGYELNAPNDIGWDFSNTPAALRSGTIKVTVRTNVGQVIGCPGDFNHSGGIEVQDIFDFLSAWFAGCQ